MFHRIGSDQKQDTVMYENTSKPRWSWGISVVKDTNIKFLSISEGTDERNRLYVKLNDNEEFQPIIGKLQAAYSLIGYKDEIFWFYTTESAVNGKIISLKIEDGKFIWNEVIEEAENNISSVNIINNNFVLTTWWIHFQKSFSIH